MNFIFSKINMHDTDNLKNCFIHLVAQSGSLKTLEFLYEKYFNTITRSDHLERFAQTLNTFNMTPLHSAAKVSFKKPYKTGLFFNCYIY